MYIYICTIILKCMVSHTINSSNKKELALCESSVTLLFILIDAAADILFYGKKINGLIYTDSEQEWLKNNIWIGGLYNYY